MNKFGNDELDDALKIFFNNATVPYDEWSSELKESYRQDMLCVYVYFNLLKKSVDISKSSI